MEKKIFSSKRALMVFLIWIVVLVTQIVLRGSEGAWFQFNLLVMFIITYMIAYHLEESIF